VSCTLVAVTVTEPAVAGAVKRPLVVRVPAVAVHVTALLVVPVTVAVNCCVVPAFTVGAEGEMVTETMGTATVMFAVADLAVSCTLVAVTVAEPMVWPAVNRPVCVIVPLVALHVTALLEALATVAVNCWVAPGATLAVVGDTVTVSTGTAMVTAAVADLVLSCWLVAVTENEPAFCPAVKRPPVVMVPPVAVQVTPVFCALATVAVNCFVAPGATVVLVGEIVTDTAGPDTVTVAVANAEPPELVAVSV
jgi:hypothetical protein